MELKRRKFERRTLSNIEMMSAEADKGVNMNNISKEQKLELMDSFGKIVIEDVRDRALRISMDIVKYKTVNPIKLKEYSVLASLSAEQQEAICNLLSETITDTIYRFLEIFEENEDDMKIIIKKDEQEYNMVEISEKMGSEIACYEDNGWIQRFSKIGRFVL